MWTAEARRRVAALRQPETSARLARALWLAWAVVVWNVVFDHVIVVAGRSYIAAAQSAPTLVNMDDWMQPAVARGLWLASLCAAPLFVAGFLFRAASPSR